MDHSKELAELLKDVWPLAQETQQARGRDGCVFLRELELGVAC